MRTEVRSRLVKAARIATVLAIIPGMFSVPAIGIAADDTRTFPETGKTVSGRFLEYWNTNGGLAQQGFPISEEMQEESVVDGKTYTVQYFERAVFEKHPEKARPYDVLLSLLGSTYYTEKYKGNAPGQKANATNPRKFAETGKTIGGVFRRYWETHGGLAQQGFPISDEFQEKSDTDGQTYTVQYFERAVFERHPEKTGTAFEVQLSLLGVSAFNGRYGGEAPLIPNMSMKDISRKSWTNITALNSNLLMFFNSKNSDFAIARAGDDGSMTPVFKLAGTAEEPITDLQLVPGAAKFLYVYQEKTGYTTISTVGDNGILTAEGVQQGQPGWTHIAIDKETGLGLFYNLATRQYATSSTNFNGGLVPLNSNVLPSTESWRYFLPIGKGLWLFARASYTAAGGHATDVARISSAGGIETLFALPGFALFTNTVSDGAHVLTYDKRSGTARTINFTASDVSVLKTLDEWSPDWSHVVASENGVITFYNDQQGSLMTARIENDGNITRLQTYIP